MVTTSSTAAPTQTAPAVALTTRFAQPAGCNSLFARSTPGNSSTSTATTTTTRNRYGYDDPTTIFTSDAANSRFSSCQPPGWDKADFTFSPGLCPSGWSWLSMTASRTGNADVSQAYCCQPGYRPITTLSGVKCYSSSYTDDGTIYLQTAWMVKWQPSDRLSVDLPDLSDQRSLGPWYPGLELAQDEGYPYPESRYWDRITRTQIVPIVVVVVVVFVAIVGCCIWGCVYRSRRKRRERLAREQAAAQAGVEMVDQQVVASDKEAGVTLDMETSVSPERDAGVASEKKTGAVAKASAV